MKMIEFLTNHIWRDIQISDVQKSFISIDNNPSLEQRKGRKTLNQDLIYSKTASPQARFLEPSVTSSFTGHSSACPLLDPPLKSVISLNGKSSQMLVHQGTL
jgi:hypothetical protein